VTIAFALQFVGSLIAVALLTALAAWAKIARPAPPLDEASARTLLAEEFPDVDIETIWLAADGRAAVARAGDEALVLARLGDGHVARALPWTALAHAQRERDGAFRLRVDDPAAPRLRFAAEVWPPRLEARA
jgi:hypothetical protein